MNIGLTKRFSWLLTAAVIAGCDGGAAAVIAGIDRLGVVSGVVAGFGSIKTNGGTYTTTNAQFNVDGNPAASQGDLEIGDVVLITVAPDDDPNAAILVVSNEAVEGPVESIDVNAGILVVAGQTVIVDGETGIDDSIPGGTLAGILVGDFIEVNGLTDSHGQIRATRIEQGQGDIDVHGIVANLNTMAETFTIGALTIDYGSVPAVIDDDFPGGTFGNGDKVEAEGETLNGGVLIATKIERDDLQGNGIDFDDFDEAEVEIDGLITRFASATDFDVDGFPSTTNGATEYEGGTVSDLGLNVRIEIDGELNNAGILVADEIDFRPDNDIRVTALVDNVNSGAGTLVVLGITIRVDALTRIEDQSDAEVEPLSLSDINVNDFVEVRGSEDGTGILAGILEREDAPDVLGEKTELRGHVESITQPSLVIAGVTIQIDGDTEYDDELGNTISEAAFFAAVAAGDLVDVNGTEITATTILAEEISLED